MHHWPHIIKQFNQNMSDEDRQNMKMFTENMFKNLANYNFPGAGNTCGGGAGGDATATTEKANAQQKATNQKSDTKNQIFVPLKNVNPKNVTINLNDKALMAISATSSVEKETNRNGLRKVTEIIEETVQLPGYLLENFVDGDEPPTKSSNNDQEQQSSSKSAETTENTKKLTLLTKVETKFMNNGLVISFPEKPVPKVVEPEKNDEDMIDEPCEIKINFV